MDGGEVRGQEADRSAEEAVGESGQAGAEGGSVALVHRAEGNRAVPEPAPTRNVRLIATDPADLARAHGEMVAWCDNEISIAQDDNLIESQNLEVAKQKHWSKAPFQRRIRLNTARIDFLGKIKEALLAGYVIIPNFSMNVFAIRTDDLPAQGQDTWSYHRKGVTFTQPSRSLPEGEGEYVNPAVASSHSVVRDGDKTTHVYESVENFSDIQYPIVIAKPELMTRAAAAMELKVFDEVGVSVDTVRGGRRGDPVLTGRILNPNPNRPDVSFFLGWYFDPSAL